MSTARMQGSTRGSQLRRLMQLRSFLAVLLLASGSATVQAAGTAAAHPDAQDVARRVCVACHGPGGRASSPLFPHLAGQPAAYIRGELRAFRAHQRGEPEARDYMWGIAGSLDDATIDALADYYAQQNPVGGGEPLARQVSTGEQLFHQGDPGRGIPACTSCHGDRGQGRDSFPRIAGQQGNYLQRQLNEMQAGQRQAPVMAKIAAGLKADDIEALAQFLSAH